MRATLTNVVDENDAPTTSLNYDQNFDLNHENLPYFNSSLASGRIRKEDSADLEATICEETPLTDKRINNSLNDSSELSENISSVDATYEKTCRMKHKSIDSKVSLNSVNMDDNDQNITASSHVDAPRNALEKSDTVAWKTVEDVKKDLRHGQDAAMRVELDTEDAAASATGYNNCYINDKDSYFEDKMNFLKCEQGDHARECTSITESPEEYNIEKTIAEIREMNEIIKNLCTSDDERENLAEERMVETLTAKMENDHDEVMRKIIESCTNVSTEFQEESAIGESSCADLEESSERPVTLRGGKFLPQRRCSGLETDIAKEDILKTIQEAEKILIDNPYRNTSEVISESYGKDSSEKFMEAPRNDEEHDRKMSEGESNPVENEDTTLNMENEEIFLDSDIIESNLQRLTELAYYDRPATHFEIHETMEKIAEEKRRIEDQKRESLDTLSKKFDEIEKLDKDLSDDISRSSDKKDHCGLMITEDANDDSDSLDEFQVDLESLELPLTKSEITESLKIEELEKELANEIEKHKKLMDEYESIITELETTSPEATRKPTQVHQKGDIEESEDTSENNEKADDNTQNGTTSETTDDTANKLSFALDDDFLSEEFKEPERTYIKGKVYEFDEKKHGIR